MIGRGVPITAGWIASRTFRSDNANVKGDEFIRRVRALGKRQDISVLLNASRGKGSHQTLYYGSAFTIVRNPKDEPGARTLHVMCAQLGIKKSDL